MNTIAEKFYYLLDAAGGHCDLTLDSPKAEIEALLQFECSKEDFDKAVRYLVEKGVVSCSDKGISIIAPLKK